MAFPYPLQAGDRLIAITPSGTLRETEVLHQSLDLWRNQGYRVDLAAGYGDRWGYLAGRDDQRRQQLAAAWTDGTYRGVVGVRGGWGAARLLEQWHWPEAGVATGVSSPSASPSAFSGAFSGVSPAGSPRWLLGFSDMTALLWSLYRAGGVGLHGPVLTTLAQEPQWSQDRLFGYLRGGDLDPLRGEGWGGGTVRGRLLPGNLTVATRLLGTPVQPDLTGVILALEDVGEVPYRLDRDLTQWRMTGAFNGVRGIALGRFSRCDPPPGVPSLTLAEVLHDRLGDLGIPIVSGLPFGHDGANALLPVGSMAVLDGDEGSLAIVA